MIEFKAKHLEDRAYSLNLVGNGGEEQFTAYTSWGQDRKSSLVIVTCQCDGHCTVVYDSKKRVIAAIILTQFEKALRKWAASGGKLDDEKKRKLDRQVKKVMEKLIGFWAL